MNNHIFFKKFSYVLFGLSIAIVSMQQVRATDAAKIRKTLNDALVSDIGNVEPLDKGLALIEKAAKDINALSTTVVPSTDNFLIKWAKSMFATTTEWWSRYICEKACCGYLDIALVQAAKKEIQADPECDVKAKVDKLITTVAANEIKTAETQLFRTDNDNGFLEQYCKVSEPVLAFVEAFNFIKAKNTQEEQEAATIKALKAARTAVTNSLDAVKGLWTKLTNAWGNTNQTVTSLKI